jgi:hypothetical protein
MGYPELSSYTIERPLERKRHYSKLFNVYDSFTRLTVLASLVLTHLYGRRSSGSSQLDHQRPRGHRLCSAYKLAITLPKTEKKTANLLRLCPPYVAVVSAMTVPALYFGGDVLLFPPFRRGPGPYHILIPPCVVISGAFLTLNNWNSRTKPCATGSRLPGSPVRLPQPARGPSGMQQRYSPFKRVE